GLPGFIALRGPARVKAFELLPALILRVAQEESTGGASSGLAARIRHRLEDISHHSTTYYFGAADRLVPWVAPQNPSPDPALRSTAITSVLTPIWDANPQARQAKLSSIMTELIK